ncbi:MAG: hypothetical protein JFR24_05610 [Muribaculaceae bacterium]|jgi:hypothetical protein|nr:hypothetical protein [Muribaculaceae bacterium]
MPRKDISLSSPRELALIVLSKLLYHIADRFPISEGIVSYHRNLLHDYLTHDIGQDNIMNTPAFSIYDIPWVSILDNIASNSPFLNEQANNYNFTTQEIRYMCAMLCGLSGKEYGLITGFKSHYNLSWSIRNKFGLPHKSTNLRIFLQKLSEDSLHESTPLKIPN